MSKEYPKMLYKGDLVSFEYVTAHSLEHEDELKGAGWIEHHELEQPDDSPDIMYSSGKSEGIDLTALVPVEQFDAVAQKLAEAEEQLATAKGEYISKINELQKENANLKYSAMGANELKAILDQKAIKYGSRDEKEALVKLVLDSEYGNGDSE
ncbi:MULTISPECIES: hypothetical protein [Acinetobacter calcoaceticus/baumannii complex]|uniref:Uncharacterized protein n=1 Tax=Acinetobacter nosocomialis TaxID=106654 RepID=A0A2L1VEA2_ACINO|nr:MULTISPECIES: hypothetical protein [Acinetobacter calcoaceticus/baumannii complex]AVF43580.1 hypothetical protein AL533_03830 [Acinetobacter nosocomialis]PNN05637.1 hypothetical protein AL489_019275 [Acinetobacter sp. FDAARGOS_131]RSN88701.1 hypothetical protein EA768_00875 [Acinetobacter nosocomialis]